MELPQSFSVEEKKQATAHSVANHTTLLEGTKRIFAVFKEHTNALCDLTHQQEKIDGHFTFSECQVDRVDEKTLGKVEEHWIDAN